MSKTAAKAQFGFSYTRKDLILYAISLGFGSDDPQKELNFLHEDNPDFASLPIFCLVLTFWSNRMEHSRPRKCGTIPSFPPPLMASEDIIPRRFLSDMSTDPSSFPIIHTWQSITWKRKLPVPCDNHAEVDTQIDLETILIEPKSVGAFVTSQSTVTTHHVGDDSSILCTLQSTALVLGIPKDQVQPFNSGVARQTFNPVIPDTEPNLEWTYSPPSNQAFLYRIASGDSNSIHVDTSVAEQMGSDVQAPLLHGLFTLGVAFRGILQICPDAHERIQALEARFTQPAFVGVSLRVRMWRRDHHLIMFQVVNDESGVVLVDCGCATLPKADTFCGRPAAVLSKL